MPFKESPKPRKLERRPAGVSAEAPAVASPGPLPGNQTLARLFRLAMENDPPRDPRPPLAALPARPPLRAKLVVGQPDDEYEREADRVADQVMRAPDERPAPAAQLHRKCAACEEENDSKLHRSEIGPAPAPARAPPIVDQVLSQPGRPLPDPTRAFFEPRLGIDLSRVRIHDNATAARSARAVQAEAYTVGNSIAFGAGRFSPQSQSGKALLAHELAHVAQQSGINIARLQRQPMPAGADQAPAPAPEAAPAAAPPPPVQGYTDTIQGVTISENKEQVVFAMKALVAKEGIAAPDRFLRVLELFTSSVTEIGGVPETGPESRPFKARYVLLPVAREAVAQVNAESAKLISDFQGVMKENALWTLGESKERAEAERTKYGITEKQETRKRFFGLYTETSTVHSMTDMESPAVRKMREAAKLLLSRRYALRSKAQELRKHTACAAGVCGKDAEYDRVNTDFVAIREDYRQLQRQIAFEFPILDRMSAIDEDEGLTEHSAFALTDLENVANGKSNIEVTAALEAQIEDALEKNEKTRAGVEAGKVNLWRLDEVYGLSKAQAALDADPFRKRAIEDQRREEQPHVIDDILQGIALLVLNLGAVALAAPTGGASLAVAFGVDAALAVKHTSDYFTEKAAAGSDLQRAQSLSRDDPSFVWLAIEIIGVGLEGAGAVAAIRALRPAARAARASRALSREAKISAEAIEGVNEAAKPFEKPQLAQNVIDKLPEGNTAVLEKIAPDSKREIGEFARATRAIESEAADVIAPSMRSSINTEVKISRAGYIFTCASPCQMLREKYAKILTSGVKLEGESRTALEQLVEFEQRAASAAQRTKLAKTPEEVAKAEQAAKALEKEIGEFETKLAAKSSPAPVKATVEDVQALNGLSDFSIRDWTGYPSGAPRPTGPFRLLEGPDYEAARKAANQANAALRKADPAKYAGKQIHEIHPVKFGGSPTDPANKIALTPMEHAQYTTWWNRLQRNLQQ